MCTFNDFDRELTALPLSCTECDIQLGQVGEFFMLIVVENK